MRSIAHSAESASNRISYLEASSVAFGQPYTQRSIIEQLRATMTIPMKSATRREAVFALKWRDNKRQLSGGIILRGLAYAAKCSE